MIRIMISDADLFAREGIKQMLATREEFAVVCETWSVQDTIRELARARADVCILDCALAKHSGLQLVRDAKKLAPHLPLVVIGTGHERDFALRTIRAGAACYLPKDCDAAQLADALKAAAAQRPYVSDTICELIVESMVDGRAQRQHDKLADTDFEIFCLLAEGVPLAEIADVCKLSIAGVRVRKHRIMQAMSFHSDVQLVEYAIRRNLIATHCQAVQPVPDPSRSGRKPSKRPFTTAY